MDEISHEIGNYCNPRQRIMRILRHMISGIHAPKETVPQKVWLRGFITQLELAPLKG